MIVTIFQYIFIFTEYLFEREAVDSNQRRGSDGRRRSWARGNWGDTAVEMCGKAWEVSEQ